MVPEALVQVFVWVRARNADENDGAMGAIHYLAKLAAMRKMLAPGLGYCA